MKRVMEVGGMMAHESRVWVRPNVIKVIKL